MAEKKNIENEIENELKNEANVLLTENYNDVDEYSVNAFGEENSMAHITSTEKLFTTKYPVQQVNVPGANGVVYENYAVAFLVTIGGNKVRQVLRLRAKGGSKASRELMNIVMSVPGEHKLEIIKRTMRDNSTGQSNHVYSMQVSCMTDDGFPMVSPLEPVGVSDKAVWENFKKQLIARGDIE